MTEKAASPLTEQAPVAPPPAGRLGDWLDRNMVLVFNTPTVIFLAGLIVFPAVLVMWTSLTDWQLISKDSAKFIGFENYITMWSDERWVRGMFNTFYYATVSVTGQFILGMATAMLFNRNFTGKTFYRSVWMMPMISMSVAISLVWAIMFNNTYGVLNHLLAMVGIPGVEWTTHPNIVIPSLILVSIWHWTPFMTLLLLAGLQSLPEDPFEAAKIDGASKWTMLIYITLPLMRGHILVALILRSIFAVKEFDTILAITDGGPHYASETMNINIYFNAFEYGYMGSSSAKGIVFFALILIIMVVLVKLRSRKWSY